MKLSQEQLATRFASAAIREVTEIAENVRRCLTQATDQNGKPLWEGATPQIVRAGFTVEQAEALDKFSEVWCEPEKKEPAEAEAPKRFRKTYGGDAPPTRAAAAGKKEARKPHGK
jgi:hypothetical protein